MVFLFSSPSQAQNRILQLFGQKADRVEEKKVEKKIWKQPETSDLQNKKFPIKEWDKHFSPLGSKRAPISVDAKEKKERFEVKVLERETVDFEMSRWNDRMADLHKRAGIQLDKKAQIVADRQLYDMMLQDRRSYRDLAGELSLRELNRFQFRRNRSAEGVPVQRAGESE